VLKPAQPVPEGKRVKCPSCGHVFGAGEQPVGLRDEEEPVQPPATPAAPPPKKEQPAPSKMKDDGEDGPATYSFAATDEPAKKPEPEVVKKKKKIRAEEDDDDDEDEDEDEDDDDEDGEGETKKKAYKMDAVLEGYLKQNRSTDPRGPATELITKPSNTLIVSFGLLTLLQIVAITYWIFPFIFSEHLVSSKELVEPDGKTPFYREPDSKRTAPEPTWEELKIAAASSKASPEKRAEAQGGIIMMEDVEWQRSRFRRFNLIGPFLMLFYAGVVVMAAVKMQSLESYNWSWTAVIMALIPVGCAGASYTGTHWIANVLGDNYGTEVSLVLFGILTLWAVVGGVRGLTAMNDPIVKAACYYKEQY
jgi:hypothetical protein